MSESMNWRVELYSTLGTEIQLLFVSNIYQQKYKQAEQVEQMGKGYIGQRAACLQYSGLFLTIIQFLMKYTLVGLAILLLCVQVAQSANNCPNPPLIIPNTFLDGIFDTAFAVNNYQTQLREFLTNPNMDTARTYITTQSSYLVTLWVFAGLSIALFVAFLIQLCCYNCCGVRKCGRRMTLNSYTPTSVSCSVYIFMFFSLLLIAITITAFIIASDLLANLDDTTCDFNGTFNYLFDGTPAGYTPVWSGADNFNQFAQNLSINFPNAMPTLNTYFQSAQYAQLTSNGSGSLFALATTYACNSGLASTTVACPFSSATSCANGSSTQVPLFSVNYCDPNVSTSSVALISGEESTNTSTWNTNLIALGQNIQQATSNPVSFSDLVSQTSSLSSNIQNLKPGLSSAIDLVHTNFYNSKLGSYITFSIIIFIGLISFLATCCVFCTRNFNCRCLFYPLWVLFAILSILFFLLSSAMLFGSFTLFGGCNAYTYYTTTPGAISSVSNSQTTQVLNTCFITNPNGSIFNTFNNTSLPTVEQIKNHYYSSLPSSSFTTVTNTIINTLAGYYASPNTVSLQGATTSQQPQAALNILNQDAKASTFCGPAGSSFQYNPTQCNPNTINPSSNPTCYLITANNSAVSNLSCITNQYQALLDYGSNVQTLTNSYMNDAGLQSYRTNYFNYYEALSSFMNGQVQAIFGSFLQPYQKLLDGSSCSFLTDSLNSLVNTSCNRDFPEMYAISCLVTAMAGCFFFMMILSYFLTTRLEFYAFLNGDFTNYDENAVEEESQTITIEMADMTTKTNRNQLLTPRK